jgi:hypothetical protein
MTILSTISYLGICDKFFAIFSKKKFVIKKKFQNIFHKMVKVCHQKQTPLLLEQHCKIEGKKSI